MGGEHLVAEVEVALLVAQHVAHDEIVGEQRHHAEHLADAVHLLAGLQVGQAGVLVAGEADELEQPNHAARQQRDHEVERAHAHPDAALEVNARRRILPVALLEDLAALSGDQANGISCFRGPKSGAFTCNC